MNLCHLCGTPIDLDSEIEIACPRCDAHVCGSCVLDTIELRKMQLFREDERKAIPLFDGKIFKEMFMAHFPCVSCNESDPDTHRVINLERNVLLNIFRVGGKNCAQARLAEADSTHLVLVCTPTKDGMYLHRPHEFVYAKKD